MEKAKNWVLAKISNFPKLTGGLVFLSALSLTLFLSSVEYQLKLASERELVIFKLNELENRIAEALNNGISASKTLAFLVQNETDVTKNFEAIATQILEANPSVDVIEYLDSGTIVAVHPMQQNESVVGMDVMKDSKNRLEVQEAINRKAVFFSGPFNLRQGGYGIVGRYPIFKNNTYHGLAAVIIYFDKLLRQTGLENNTDSDFVVRLSRVNPQSGISENFIPVAETKEPMGPKASVFIPTGNWNLTVQLKESQAFSKTVIPLVISIGFSLILGYVAWSFARLPAILRTKLKEQSHEILLANERFELATKATSDVIWDWNLQTNEIYRSLHFYQMFGYPEGQKGMETHFWTGIIHPDDREEVLGTIQKAFEVDTPYWEQEFRVRRSDSSYAFITNRSYIVRDTEGKPIRLIGAVQDITKRKIAEGELHDANKSLSNANEELKVFASLASHDLREPLRMISSFLTLLQKKYGNSLDEKGQQYISFAIDGSNRMTKLIHDLLEYSKVGFDLKSLEPIQVNQLVSEVLQFNADLIRESGAEVLVDDLPEIRGIKVPLQILFQNLIGNALKYRNKTLDPKILISGRALKDFWEFSIQDNGIGIDPDYLEYIFGILKRLHPKEAYPGTGLGLATCRKIVNQHGGKIWAESLPEGGSKFLFTIKKYG